MAASPGADALLSIGDTYSSPSLPSSPVVPPTQENSLTTVASPEPSAHLDHTTPAPPPPSEQDTAEYSELGESLPLTDCGDLAPLRPPTEAPPAASPALEAASPEKPASPPSCAPDARVEILPDVAASAASPPPSPQIAQAPPVDAPPPMSAPATPPATTSPRAALDSSATEVGAMASQEAASPPPAFEPVSHSAPAPLTLPLEGGPEGLSLQKHPRTAAPEMTPQVCENSEPARPPLLQAGSTDLSSDTVADGVAEVASAEAAGSPPALGAMDGERDTAPDVPPALECGMEGELPQQQLRSPRSEFAPPQCQNSEPAELTQVPPLTAESTYCSLESAVNEVAVVASEEAAGSPHTLDATGGEAALETRSEGPLQEQVQISSSPKMEAEPCSPDMAPPGFENFKSKWLPLPAPTLPVESTQYLVEVSATGTVCMMPEAAAGSLPALETIGVEMGIPPGQVPSSKGAEDRPLRQPLKVASSLSIEDAPCSPDTPPPGFENFKTSWLPQPNIPPSAKTTYSYSPDVTSTKEEPVENACSVPALGTTVVETGTARSLLPTLESGAGGLLQGSEPSSPSPTMQAAPCSPYIMPPVFESVTLPEFPLPSPIETSHILQDSVATEAVCLTSEDAPQPSPLLKAMNVEMDAAPALPTSLENGAHESMQQESSQLPSCTVQGTTSPLEVMSSGSYNLESLADAVTVEAVGHPLPVAEAAEEAEGRILPPPLENGCDGPLPCLEPKTSFPVMQVVPSSAEITHTGFESVESSEQTSSRLAEGIDSPSHLPVTKSVIVKSEKIAQPLSPSRATDTDLENAPVVQLPSKSEEKPLSHPQHQHSSTSGKDVSCSPDIAPPGYENFDSSEELPPPPPLCPNFELGQMVCGCCRELLAYPRGATHVQCFGCWTINLVLEAHQIGKVYCGQCETLLMYPFGAPAVRCSTCLFVTEIGDRNVHPRMSVEQGTPPRLQELGQAEPV